MARASLLNGWEKSQHHRRSLLSTVDGLAKGSMPPRSDGWAARAAVTVTGIHPKREKPRPKSYELEGLRLPWGQITFRGCGFRPSSCLRTVQKRRVPGPSRRGHDAICSCGPQDAAHQMPKAPKKPVQLSPRQNKNRAGSATAAPRRLCYCKCAAARRDDVTPLAD